MVQILTRRVILFVKRFVTVHSGFLVSSSNTTSPFFNALSDAPLSSISVDESQDRRLLVQLDPDKLSEPDQLAAKKFLLGVLTPYYYYIFPSPLPYYLENL